MSGLVTFTEKYTILRYNSKYNSKIEIKFVQSYPSKEADEISIW